VSHPTNASSYVLPTKPIVGVRGEFGSRQTSSVSPIAATPTSAITDGHQRTYLNATAWKTEARAQQGDTMTRNRIGTRTMNTKGRMRIYPKTKPRRAAKPSVSFIVSSTKECSSSRNSFQIPNRASDAAAHVDARAPTTMTKSEEIAHAALELSAPPLRPCLSSLS